MCSTIINSVPPTAKGFILLSHYSRDSFRQGWPKRRLTTKFFTISAITGIRSIFRKIGKEIYVRKPKKFLSWRWRAVFYWPEKSSAQKMASQPRRAAADTESLSLWRTCWALWPRQDERKGLYLIHWCFSWTLKLWLQFNLSFLTVVFLFFFLVTSRYYWARLLEDCDDIVKRCDVCQRTSKKFEKPSAQLHPIKIKDTVASYWYRFGRTSARNVP